MEAIAGFVGFVILCLIMLGLLRLACGIANAWHDFQRAMRGESPLGSSVETPSHSSPQGTRTPTRSQSNVISYRTRNGRTDYRFDITRRADGDYRVYIKDLPDYGSRDASCSVTHRLRDSRGHYVCWTGRIASAEQARKVAALWADNTEDYILHGRRF